MGAGFNLCLFLVAVNVDTTISTPTIIFFSNSYPPQNGVLNVPAAVMLATKESVG